MFAVNFFVGHKFREYIADDVIRSPGIFQFSPISRNIRSHVNFAALQFFGHFFPTYDRNIFKFAIHIIRQKFHILIAVAGIVSGNVLIEKTDFRHITDFVSHLFAGKHIKRSNFRLRFRVSLPGIILPDVLPGRADIVSCRRTFGGKINRRPGKIYYCERCQKNFQSLTHLFQLQNFLIGNLFCTG